VLFNSYAFLFVFLPVTLLGYEIAGRFGRRAVIGWLALASLGFYGYWKPAFLVLLVGSIAVNYVAAGLISRQIPNRVAPRVWLVLAITANLATLGYFKYCFPMLNFTTAALRLGRHWQDVLLPVGISFFTFTQTAYLVDLYQGVAKHQDIPSYVLFVTFFPHLIAGPILHHKEMMPQFQEDRPYRLRANDLAVGFSWFIMGLAKKTLLADSFAPIANAAFAYHGVLPAPAAWGGMVCYALQLYFDFSGYSDMALGLARMFSINFPLNFSSPYKARNITDFWQRWHMTLTAYITDYLYTPLQIKISAWRMAHGKKVSRKAQSTPGGFASMVAFPTLFTMFIAGIWHGAGLQFLVFGLMHGTFLTINHGWRLLRHKSGEPAPVPAAIAWVRHAAGVVVTFVCVLTTLAFFRAASLGQGAGMVGSMAGLHGFGRGLAGVPRLATTDIAMMVGGLVIVWGLPNTQQILSRFKPALRLGAADMDSLPKRLLWAPRLSWMLALGVVFFVALVHLEDPSTFLYFQF